MKENAHLDEFCRAVVGELTTSDPEQKGSVNSDVSHVASYTYSGATLRVRKYFIRKTGHFKCVYVYKPCISL